MQQRVEILKALSHDARLLVLDEPTAVLTPQETDELITVMQRLRDGGTSIIFISHKLHEVRRVADTITVLRRGKVVGQAEPTSTNAELASLMVGRPVQLVVDKEPAQPGEVLLDVRDLTVVDDARRRAGRRRLVQRARRRDLRDRRRPGQRADRAHRGARRARAAERRLDRASRARRSSDLSTDEILDLGVGYVPEDRLHDGLVGAFSVAENLVLDMFDGAPFARRGVLDLRAIEQQRRAPGRASSTSGPTDPAAAAGTLSGGNQQKVVLARELSRPLRLLVVAQPTRGLDVGSMEFVHRRIVAGTRPRRRRRPRLDRARRGAGPGRPDRRHVPRPDRRRGRRRARLRRRSDC